MNNKGSILSGFMQLNDTQYNIVKSFMDRYLPGQGPSGVYPIALKYNRTYLGINFLQATTFAQSCFHQIFVEKPNISQKEFDQQMLRRIPVLHKLSLSLESLLGRVRPKDKKAAYFFVSDFFESQPDYKFMDFGEQVKSFRLNMRFLPAWLAARPVQIGDYIFENIIGGEHPEALFCVKVKTEKGELIATIGGHLYYHKGKTGIRITNIQGVKKHSQESTESHLLKYTRLTEQLKENWRVYFVKQILKTAKNKRAIIGELPFEFALIGPTATKSEFRRQVRQYRQTYKKAGLKEHKKTQTWRYSPRKRKK